jgi:hypothetical protein
MVTFVTTYLKGRKPNEVLLILKELKVDLVLDVRWWAVYPLYFNPNIELKPPLESFSILLMENQIEYRYEALLGNPSWLRDKYIPINDWEGAKKAYYDWIFNGTYKGTKIEHVLNGYISGFKKIWANKTVCIVCYCPTEDPRHCHRYWLKELFEKYLE